ncbi:MAG: hypothetical protein HYT07_01895 [Candidatus Levybacteria bacterium]|nr:hypothetical protein [Candidatus Levybacteria bacterium]
MTEIESRTTHASSSYAQSVFDNLRRAVDGGAIGACYDDGVYQIYPNHVVDKDGFESCVNTYANHLLGLGVDRRAVRNNVTAIIGKFHAATAREQHDISTNLVSIVNGLGRVNNQVR